TARSSSRPALDFCRGPRTYQSAKGNSMSGRSSETSNTAATPALWFIRLRNAIGVLFGVLMMATLVILLRAEEQAAHTARVLEEGAAVLVPVSAERVDPDNEGKLVHVSGPAGT